MFLQVFIKIFNFKAKSIDKQFVLVYNVNTVKVEVRKQKGIKGENMTYIINPWWFYLINVVDTLRVFSLVIFIVSIMGVVLLVAVCIGMKLDGCDDNDEDYNLMKVWCRRSVIILIISTLLVAFIPSKTTCIEMLAASKATTENVQTVKEEIYDFIDYIVDEVDGNNEKD